jgi:hypothetical protein
MTQLQQGGDGAEAAIHATSRGRSCNPRHRSCKSRPPVLQTAVVGAAKAVLFQGGWCGEENVLSLRVGFFVVFLFVFSMRGKR